MAYVNVRRILDNALHADTMGKVTQAVSVGRASCADKVGKA